MAERPQTTAHAPEAPAPVAPHEETPVNGEEVTFQWKPVEGADAYFLEVARDANFDEVVFQQKQEGEETSFALPDALRTDGDLYFWRVRARREGQWSPGDRIESFVSVTATQARQAQTEEIDEAPDRRESYGPAAELVEAAGVEATAEATGSDPLMEREREMGVAHEGVEAGQIIGLMGVVIVVVIIITVVLIYWVSNVAQFEQQQVAERSRYPELEALETEAAQQLGQYELLSEQDGTYRIPIDEAMRIVADEAYQSDAGRTYSQELPLRPPPARSDTAEASPPTVQLTEEPAGN